MLDIFKNDAFSVVSLTEAMDKLPYVPGKLGASGLFKFEGITTTVAVVEERHGRLSLLQTKARGTMEVYERPRGRKARAFLVPHIPINDNVYADDVQGVRAFGTEDEVETIAALVNDKLATMKQDMEVTVEHHRIGALHGHVLDADGTELYNWFNEFGITQHEVTFDLSVDSIKRKSQEVIRLMEEILGGTPYTKIMAVCGNNFWDDMMDNTLIATAFDRWQDGLFFREQQNRDGFPFAGIQWWNYRGKVGDRSFINTNSCRFYPVGVPGLFAEIYAPADFIETVNTKGKKWYAKQEVMKFDKGIELHGQSNPLVICKRPAVLIKGARSDEGSSSGE